MEKSAAGYGEQALAAARWDMIAACLICCWKFVAIQLTAPRVLLWPGAMRGISPLVSLCFGFTRLIAGGKNGLLRAEPELRGQILSCRHLQLELLVWEQIEWRHQSCLSLTSE